MNQSHLINSEKLSSLGYDQNSSKHISKEAIAESEVILMQQEKYNTEKYNTKNTTHNF